MSLGKQVIYVDESSFHKWLLPGRAWVRRDMVLQMPSNRGSSMTVIGAISEKQGLVHYKILRGSNNTDAFVEFTQELIKKIKGDAAVYMDNYSVHYSKRVKEFFNDRVQQRFLPPYSCALNPIEKLWLVAKGRWRKMMLERPDGLTEDEMETSLKTIIESYRE